MESMNSTTITISDKTRRELLRVAGELQSRTGKKVDYEEVIEYLLLRTRKRPDLLRRATAAKGIGAAELQRVLQEGMAEDRKREEELERRYG